MRRKRWLNSWSDSKRGIPYRVSLFILAIHDRIRRDRYILDRLPPRWWRRVTHDSSFPSSSCTWRYVSVSSNAQTRCREREREREYCCEFLFGIPVEEPLRHVPASIKALCDNNAWRKGAWFVHRLWRRRQICALLKQRVDGRGAAGQANGAGLDRCRYLACFNRRLDSSICIPLG